MEYNQIREQIPEVPESIQKNNSYNSIPLEPCSQYKSLYSPDKSDMGMYICMYKMHTKQLYKYTGVDIQRNTV